MDEQYIGDGLYASFDGFGFMLRAPRADGEHWVYLEPRTLADLNRFVESTRPKPKIGSETSRGPLGLD
jgi:hypothetical protein